MNSFFYNKILEYTNAESVLEIKNIQTLWGGYGKIQRLRLQNARTSSVVIKYIQFPPVRNCNDISHQRKVKSYEVEMAWYRNWNQLCTESCRTPMCYGMETRGNESLIVLEDLDAVGYSSKRHYAGITEAKLCLQWLANFHAIFMNCKPEGIWEKGTYWHLDTRPEELRVLKDHKLKSNAKKIDQGLNQCCYQTFVHGDAKLANFCFSTSTQEVSAVDFQYVGKGCGMKDVAYLLDSCLSPSDCAKYESVLLDFYFDALAKALAIHQPHIHPQEVEADWRPMYKWAWADFYRFLKGWSPGYYDNSYSEKLINDLISELT